MITRLRVKNFRLLAKADLELARGAPTVLVGPNASGKSTVVEAFDFLRTAADEGLQEALLGSERGGLDMVRTAGASGPVSFEIAAELEDGAPGSEGRISVEYGFALEVSAPARHVVRSERLSIVDREASTGAGATVLERGYTKARLRDATSGETDSESRVQENELAIWAIRDLTRYPEMDALRRELLAIAVYFGFHDKPSWARARRNEGSARESRQLVPASRLDPWGHNLTDVLFSLQQRSGRAWKDLVRHFTAEFPHVKKISFPPIGGGRVTMSWTDRRFRDHDFYPEHMSDGMVALLQLLAATSDHGEPASALVFDEPELHLHPSAVRRLALMLDRAAERRTVVAATHSDHLLDHLGDPAGSIRICEVANGCAAFRRLDADRLKVWLKDYALSDLRRRNLVDSSNRETGEP